METAWPFHRLNVHQVTDHNQSSEKKQGFVVFEMGSHYADLAGLELKGGTCLCLPSTEVKGV